LNNKLVDLKNLTNHHNGGLTIYWLKRNAIWHNYGVI
jgi:hypothetical protein